MIEVFVFALGLAIFGYSLGNIFIDSTIPNQIMISAAFIMIGASLGAITRIFKSQI